MAGIGSKAEVAEAFVMKNPILNLDFDGTVLKVIRLDRLRLPLHVCLGYYEAATDEELIDYITDLRAELDRRKDEPVR